MALKSIVGNNILPAVLVIPTAAHCFSIAVDIDLFYGHCSAKIMQHCTTARNIAVAFKGARRVRGIRDSNRAIVPDKVCTGITPITMRCASVFCNCIPIQIQHNLLAFFDHQSGNAFIPGGHMLFCAIFSPLLQSLARHTCTPLIWRSSIRMNAHFISGQRIYTILIVFVSRASAILCHFFCRLTRISIACPGTRLIRVIKQCRCIQHFQCNTICQLNGSGRSVCRRKIQRCTQLLFIFYIVHPIAVRRKVSIRWECIIIISLRPADAAQSQRHDQRQNGC